MASPVGYQTFCPVGAALNVVGERWALLIVRDLFLGPRRYSELLKGLGGIPTDILAARLRTLQEQGVVRQVGEGRARRYELTESGQALRPVLRELGRWGADRLRLPADPAEIPTRVPLTSLLIGARRTPPGQRRVRGSSGRRDGPRRSRRGADPRCPRQRAGHHDRADPSRNEGTHPRRSRSDIEQAGDLSIQGDRRHAHALLNALTGPPRLAGLRPQLQGGLPAGSRVHSDGQRL